MVETEVEVEVETVLINAHTAFSDQSTKTLTVVRHGKMMDVWRRDARTNCTATPMGTNVSTDTTMLIVCTQKKDTNPVPWRRIHWEIVYYTNDSYIVQDGVGRDKGVAKRVSFKR